MCRMLVRSLSLGLAVTAHSNAADLVATAKVEPAVDGARAARVELVWKNAWRDDRNHDAVWFVLRDAATAHEAPLRLARTATSGDGARRATVVVSDDGVGAFVSVADAHRGDVALSVIVARADGRPMPSELRVDALEMVYVPAGGFELGDDDPAAMAQGAFYVPGSGRRSLGPYRVRDESEIPISLKPGDLYYDVGNVPQYRGDQQGPLPAAYPKGTRAFYVMKYETRQGDYARFLGALPAAWRSRRTFTPGEKDEEAATWSIARDGDAVVAAAPSRAANFLSFDDSAAFLDWFGLRPLSELEFEKAARGPKQPCDLDFPWGVATSENVKRRVTRDRDLAESSAAAESATDPGARERLAQSFYGVFDLAGGVWERVITVGHPNGRAFVGSHGDGELDPTTGDATNVDWPRGSADGKAADGIGYRGGAEYFNAAADITNPFSAVAVRTYGAWNGAYRYKTYGARGCRTAPSTAVVAAEPRSAPLRTGTAIPVR